MANQQLGFEVVGKSNASEVMGKAGKEADKLAKKIKHAFDFKAAIVESVLGAFGAAALIEKVISSITEGISHMAKIKQESEKSNMDPSEFAKLAIVAEKSGVSVESLGNAIRSMKIKLKDAMTDTTMMTRFTKGLGFAEEDLRNGKIKTIDIVTRIAQAMASEENETTKLAIATAFLSERFANELLPTLEQIGKNPDIFKGINTQADETYNKADRAMQKWSELGRYIGEVLSISTMDFLEHPFAPGYEAPITDDDIERIDKANKKLEDQNKISPEAENQINQDLKNAGITTGLLPENKTNVEAITASVKNENKDTNTIANSLGASMGNGPTSGVIGVGNNAQFTLMEEQLDTLKAIRDSIDKLGTPQGMNTDFTKESYQDLT